MPDHVRYRELVEGWIGSDAAFGLADVVLSGFLRIVTNPRVFGRPSTMDEALSFLDPIRNAPNRVRIEPGPRHWDIFARLCRETDAQGNLVADAYLAALAIESGSEWLTTDRDFRRFPGLRWRHPLRG